MPTSSSRKQPPLRPTYRIERARIEEYNRMFAEANARYPDYPVCPDCFKPPHLCPHMNLKLPI